MTITAALVLYAVLWFLVLFVALPIRVRTQAEDGAVVPGTPASAPADPMLRRKFLWVTVAATALWAAVCAVILWGGLTVRDLDVWGRM
jgi:predicted secreted protein